MRRTFDPEEGIKHIEFNDLETYRELLHVLLALDGFELDMPIMHYDEESDIIWPSLKFIITKEDFIDSMNEYIDVGQPLFWLPR